MSNLPLQNGNYLGAGDGQYRNAYSQAQSSAAQAPAPANLGAFPGLNAYAAQQAALANAYCPSPPALTDAGIRAGEIIGYRAWTYRRGLLWSMAASYCWVPGETVTGNVRGHLGVHAFKSMGNAIGQYGFAGVMDVVFGTIAMWGDVIEHEMGWRAEYAAIESVTVLGTPDQEPSKRKFWRRAQRDTLATIRRTYGLQQ